MIAFWLSLKASLTITMEGASRLSFEGAMFTAFYAEGTFTIAEGSSRLSAEGSSFATVFAERTTFAITAETASRLTVEGSAFTISEDSSFTSLFQ